MNIVTSCALAYISTFIREQAIKVISKSSENVNINDQKWTTIARNILGLSVVGELLGIGATVILLTATATTIPTMLSIGFVGLGFTLTIVYFRKDELKQVDELLS